MCMGRNRDQPWSYRYGDLTPSRPDQFGNPSLAGEPMIRLERVPAESGFWHRERLQVVRTFPITPFELSRWRGGRYAYARCVACARAGRAIASQPGRGYDRFRASQVPVRP